MMMMMMMKKFAVVLVLAVVPVVRAEVTDPCDGLSGEKCLQEENCKFDCLRPGLNTCFSIAGKGSVVRQGVDNRAPGEFCTTGGGKKNTAGYIDDSYNVIGGGQDHRCFGNKNTIAGGKDHNVSGGDGINSCTKPVKLNTISGGFYNSIIGGSRYSVITGGADSYISADTGTISGGSQNIVNFSGNTVTGGQSHGLTFNADTATNSVMTGGNLNVARGESSVVVGGAYNLAKGDYSIALGENAKAEKDNSMAVNLMKNGEELVTEQDGQFVMNAESFRFQIKNGKDKNGAIQSTKMTYENIDNLASALAE